MGKTSIARELGRRLEADGWIFLFADVEGSTCAEDAIAAIAKETYFNRSIASRFGRSEKLLQHCADHDAPVLLVIDELPIFLKGSC